MVPEALTKVFPEDLNPEDIQKSVEFNSSVKGSLGETFLILCGSEWLAFSRSSMLEDFSLIKLDKGKPFAIKKGEWNHTLTLLTSEGESIELEISSMDQSKLDELDPDKKAQKSSPEPQSFSSYEDVSNDKEGSDDETYDDKDVERKLSPYVSNVVLGELIGYLKVGKKFLALKRYREETEASLSHAKDVIEEITNEFDIDATQAEQPPSNDLYGDSVDDSSGRASASRVSMQPAQQDDAVAKRNSSLWAVFLILMVIAGLLAYFRFLQE